MMRTATITIRVSADIEGKLSRLAKHRRRTTSSLAAEAVSTYVEDELEVVELIKRGLDDVEAGRFVSHEQVVVEAREIIADARRR